MSRENALIVLSILLAVSIIGSLAVVKLSGFRFIHLCLALVLGIAFVLVRFWFSRNDSLPKDVEPRPLNRPLLYLFFWLFFGASLVALYLVDYQSTQLNYLYFIMIAGAAAVTAITIPSAKSSGAVGVSLLQSLLIAVNLRFSLTLVFFGVASRDAPYHIYNVTRGIVETGSIPPGTIYTYYPAQHLISAFVILVTGGDVWLVSCAVGAFTAAIGALFVYLLAREYVSGTAALFAALLFGIAEHPISNGAVMAILSLTPVLALVILYAILEGRRSLKFSFLAVLFMVLLILTHHWSAALVILIVMSLLATQILYRYFPLDRKGLSVNFWTVSFLYMALVVVYWMYFSKTFEWLGSFVTFFAETDVHQAATLSSVSSSRPMYINWLTEAGLAFLIFLSVYSVLRRIDKPLSVFKVILITSSAAFFAYIAVGYVFPAFYQFLPGRVYSFVEPLLVIPAADALAVMFFNRGSFMKLGVLAVVFLVAAIFMTTSVNAFSTFTPVGGRYAVSQATQPEFLKSAVGWLSERVPGSDTVQLAHDPTLTREKVYTFNWDLYSAEHALTADPLLLNKNGEISFVNIKPGACIVMDQRLVGQMVGFYSYIAPDKIGQVEEQTEILRDRTMFLYEIRVPVNVYESLRGVSRLYDNGVMTVYRLKS